MLNHYSIFEEHKHVADEFEKAMQSFAAQSITTAPYKINPIKLSNQEQRNLSLDQAWALEISKALRVHDYLTAIPFSIVIPGTYRKTAQGQSFQRLSIQPAWLDDQMTIIKEEVHIIEDEHRIVFYGRPVDELEAQNVMREHFNESLIRKEVPLFHVVHGLLGTENEPINTWRMVFIDQQVSAEQISMVKEIISKLDWNGLYAKADSLVAKKNQLNFT
ncbi:MAG: hypothetical protein AB7F64_09315 [Gammaproteobacteria bacterium]